MTASIRQRFRSAELRFGTFYPRNNVMIHGCFHDVFKLCNISFQLHNMSPKTGGLLGRECIKLNLCSAMETQWQFWMSSRYEVNINALFPHTERNKFSRRTHLNLSCRNWFRKCQADKGIGGTTVRWINIWSHAPATRNWRTWIKNPSDVTAHGRHGFQLWKVWAPNGSLKNFVAGH